MNGGANHALAIEFLTQEAIHQPWIIQAAVNLPAVQAKDTVSLQPGDIAGHFGEAGTIADLIYRILKLAAPRDLRVMIQHEAKQRRAGSLSADQKLDRVKHT